jgi:glycerol-3-phosphate dehydrogenase subunit B
LCVGNLTRGPAPTGATVEANAYGIDLAARDGEADCSALAYARALDDPAYRARFAQAVAGAIGGEAAVGLPAMLGLRDLTVWQDLSELIGRPVFEIALPPPGVPGMRLNAALLDAARRAGVRVIVGSPVIGAQTGHGHVEAVLLGEAGRDRAHSAGQFLHAPGGFESGALAMASDGAITETVFNLPLIGADRQDLLTWDYWQDQALFAVGVAVDGAGRPVGPDGRPVYDNLYAAGGILAGAIRWTEKSGEGIALGSAMRATDAIIKEA